eukprot:gene4455-6704_t
MFVYITLYSGYNLHRFSQPKLGQLTGVSSPSNKEKIIQAVQVVEEHAKSQGLSNEQLLQLSLIATSGAHCTIYLPLDVAVSRRIIRAMIPRMDVEVQVVIRLISRFSHPMLHRSLQMPHLCHILYRITEKKDVQPHRIRRLMRLQQQMGAEPCLIALLSCYKLLQPTMVTLVIPSTTRKRWFPVIDKNLVNDILRVQQQRHSSVAGFGPKEDLVELSALLRTNTMIPNVKAAMDTLHERKLSSISHSNKTASKMLDPGDAIQIYRNGTVEDISRHLGRLPAPAQFAAALKQTNLRYVLSIEADPLAIHRLTYWLYAQLLDGDEKINYYSQRFDHMLNTLSDFVAAVQALFTLLANVPPRSFPDHHRGFFQPLSHLLTYAPLDLTISILECFRMLLARYSKFPWSLIRKKNFPENGLYRHVRYLFHDINNVILSDDDTFLDSLILFVDMQCELCIQRWPGHENVLHHVCSIYDCLGSLCRKQDIAHVSIPSQGVVYDFLASSSAFSLSRICGILAKAREDFDYYKTSVKQHISNPKPIPRTNVFNCYILDIVCMLWRGTIPGKETDQTIVFDGFEDDPLELNKATMSGLKSSRSYFWNRIEACIHPDILDLGRTHHGLSLAYCVWTCAYSLKFLKSEADHQGGIQLVPAQAQKRKRQLWRYLGETCCMEGLYRFLETSITALQSENGQT